MAGSEAAGVESAKPDLFVNAAYVLTPTDKTDSEALALVQSLADGIGSRIIVMDPESHDRCAAVISHLPHLIAAALVSLAQEQSHLDPQVFDLIAGSFRDMTRVASSPPVIWRDICMTNLDAIRDAAEVFRRLLDEGVKLVEAKDGKAFEDWYASAKAIRDALPSTGNREALDGE
jgi:prephenate dehydrogenase